MQLSQGRCELASSRLRNKPDQGRFEAGAANVLVVRHKLDPWVLSGGVYLRL